MIEKLKKRLSKRVTAALIAAVTVFIATLLGTQATTLPEIRDKEPRISAGREVVRVERVIDGDTIVLADGRKVRFIGIDAPETGKGFDKQKECFHAESTARNRELIEGKNVTIVRDKSDTDRYGRLLRYIFVEDLFVNEELVRGGFAIARRYSPDISHAITLDKAQKLAHENKNGMWGICDNRE